MQGQHAWPDLSAPRASHSCSRWRHPRPERARRAASVFPTWQGPQIACRLPMSSVPPSASSLTWSTSRARVRRPASLHTWHIPQSRASTAARSAIHAPPRVRSCADTVAGLIVGRSSCTLGRCILTMGPLGGGSAPRRRLRLSMRGPVVVPGSPGICRLADSSHTAPALLQNSLPRPAQHPINVYYLLHALALQRTGHRGRFPGLYGVGP